MIKIPSQKTLDKYGLSEDRWLEILHSQDDLCPICKKQPTTGRFVVDHDHCVGFKKLPPEDRRKHIRGLCCWWCNKNYIGRSITIEKSKNVTAYLETYEARKLEQDQKLDT